jgi:hypothetical protein
MSVLSVAAVCIGTGAGAVSDPRSVAMVLGHVWDADASPIADATLRLRNVVSGGTPMTTVSNESGEFTFSDVATGTYLVEYIDERGRLLAVSHTFGIAPGETVATFVRLRRRRPWYAEFFRNTAAAAVSSAAAIGVTAVVPTGQDISPIVP